MSDDPLADLRRRYTIGDPQRQVERVARQMASDEVLRQQVFQLAAGGDEQAVQSLDLAFDSMPEAVLRALLVLAAADRLSHWRIRRIVLQRLSAARERPDCLAALGDLAARSELGEVREEARKLLGVRRSITELVGCIHRAADALAIDGAFQELAGYTDGELTTAATALASLADACDGNRLLRASRLLARSGATEPPPALLTKAASERSHEQWDHPPARFGWLSEESGDSPMETERIFRANAVAAAVAAGRAWWPAGCPAEPHPQGWAYLLRAIWIRLGRDGLHAAFVTAVAAGGTTHVRGPEHELLFLLAWYALAKDGDVTLATTLVEAVQAHRNLWTLREQDMIRIMWENRRRR